MKDEILIQIKHKTEDPDEIRKYIVNAICLTQRVIGTEEISEYINKPIKRIVYVPDRMLSIVTES